jgi:hypothetical protein
MLVTGQMSMRSGNLSIPESNFLWNCLSMTTSSNKKTGAVTPLFSKVVWSRQNQ